MNITIKAADEQQTSSRRAADEQQTSSRRAADEQQKRQLGQFYTIANPFHHNLFHKWLTTAISSVAVPKILEPFAGSNNIVELINSIGYNQFAWTCFDINPAKYNRTPQFNVLQRDTISNFPTGYNIAITNPPYLAKNSAIRMGLDFPYQYDDLYQVALSLMLTNCEYVAAIIPESFLTQNRFFNRLYAVISLNCRMFEDTECPVCLALFSPKIHNELDFDVVVKGICSKYKKLKDSDLAEPTKNLIFKFNDPNGSIGLYALDNTKSASIKFVPGQDITAPITYSSRAITRFSLSSAIPVSLPNFIADCNQLLNKYRTDTFDVFMTAFKGLRDDGCYRRRLDFATAKRIIAATLKTYELSY